MIPYPHNKQAQGPSVLADKQATLRTRSPKSISIHMFKERVVLAGLATFWAAGYRCRIFCLTTGVHPRME